MSVHKIIIAVLILAIVCLSVYAAVLSGRLTDARAAAAQQAERAESAEHRAAELERSVSALKETQAYADEQNKKINRAHSETLWRIDDIIDSGALDERVCELARAAYDSLVCTSNDSTLPATGTPGTP